VRAFFSSEVGPACKYRIAPPQPRRDEGLAAAAANPFDAARNLAMEVDGLTPEEKDTLSKSLDGLVRDTPGTTVAATRFKRLATKAGGGVAGAFKGILVSVVSETAKKILWP
jgi:hypothetical protein